MLQNNIENRANLKPEGPEPMNIDEEFPLFTVIMMVLCLITAAIAFVDFVVTTFKHGF